MNTIDKTEAGNIRRKRLSGDLAYRKRYLRLTASVNEQVEIERRLP